MNDEFELANYTKWCCRIPGYYAMKRNQKKNAKIKWREEMNLNNYLDVPQTANLTPRSYSTLNDLECKCYIKPPSPIKRKSAMQSTANLAINASVNTDADTRRSERIYLEIRASNVYHAKKDKVRETFGLSDQKYPTSPKELVERIKSGMFVLPTDWVEEDESTPNWYMNKIRWRDPAKVEDKDGYKVAAAQLTTEYNKVLDSIHIKNPSEALPELQAWETAT